MQNDIMCPKYDGHAVALFLFDLSAAFDFIDNSILSENLSV